MPTPINWSLVTYFSTDEFACKCGCGTNNPTKDLVYKINSARIYAGIPFRLNSACRCQTHNRNIRGLADSAHLTYDEVQGTAIDIDARTSEVKFIVVEALVKAGFKRIFIYGDFIHADLDDSKPTPSLRGY